jgi:hypothetical protein
VTTCVHSTRHGLSAEKCFQKFIHTVNILLDIFFLFLGGQLYLSRNSNLGRKLTRYVLLLSGGGVFVSTSWYSGWYSNPGISGAFVLAVIPWLLLPSIGVSIDTQTLFCTVLPSFLVTVIVSGVTAEANSTSPSTKGSPLPLFRLLGIVVDVERNKDVIRFLLGCNTRLTHVLHEAGHAGINKTKSRNNSRNAVRHICPAHLSGTSVRHNSSPAHLSGTTAVRHIYPALLSGTSVRHICPAHLSGTSVRHICPAHLSSTTAVRHIYLAHLSGTSIWHICPAHLSGTTAVWRSSSPAHLRSGTAAKEFIESNDSAQCVILNITNFIPGFEEFLESVSLDTLCPFLEPYHSVHCSVPT